MPTANAIFVKTSPGAEALPKFLQLCAQHFRGQGVQLSLGFNMQAANVNNVQVPMDGIANRPEVVKSISALQSDSFDLWQASISASNRSIVYNSNEPWRTHLVFNNFSAQEIVDAVSSVSSQFTVVQEAQIVSANIPQLQLDIIRANEATFAALAAETAKIERYSLEQLSRQEEFLRKATADLRAQFDEQQMQLAERRRLTEEELAEKRKHTEEAIGARRKEFEEELRAERASLDEKRREHEEKVHKFNLEENKAVRRELLERMQKAIAEQKAFTLSDETNKKRDAVRQSCLLTGGIALLAALSFGIKFFRADAPDWHILVPLSASTLTLVSTFIYFVRWNDHWFREHARAEIRTKRFSEHILRASWIAELFFETKDKNVQVPDALFTNFSQGLFSDDQLAETQHPADQMVELIKKISSIEASKDGVKVTKATEK